jgi:hypothetical protein
MLLRMGADAGLYGLGIGICSIDGLWGLWLCSEPLVKRMEKENELIVAVLTLDSWNRQ